MPVKVLGNALISQTILPGGEHHLGKCHNKLRGLLRQLKQVIATRGTHWCPSIGLTTHIGGDLVQSGQKFRKIATDCRTRQKRPRTRQKTPRTRQKRPRTTSQYTKKSMQGIEPGIFAVSSHTRAPESDAVPLGHNDGRSEQNHTLELVPRSKTACVWLHND